MTRRIAEYNKKRTNFNFDVCLKTDGKISEFL